MSKPEIVRRGKQSKDGLMLSHDRKTSPAGRLQESNQRWVPSIPNSFGLPAGDSCPGKTPFCESCYAANSENGSGVRELVTHNLELLREAGSIEAMSQLLSEVVERYQNTADIRKIEERDRIFRVHWDGDFFSEDYAQAWANTMRQYPDIKFWAYTRSFREPVNVVPILANVDNLELYLSADLWNIKEALGITALYTDVHLALCDEDYEGARALSPDRPSLVCPENNGRMDLMSEGRGACVECRLCPDGKRDVLFATSGREYGSPQMTLPLEEGTWVQFRESKPSTA